LGVPSFIA